MKKSKSTGNFAVGSVVRCVCADMNSFGSGVCFESGCPDGRGAAIFVPGAVTGDECDVQITKADSRSYTGSIVRIITPSQHRREPECPHFSECGGCDFLHISRELELEVKQHTVAAAFRREKLTDIAVDPTVTVGEAYHYRNKAVVHPANGGFGFFSGKTHDIAAHDKCLLYPDYFAEIFSAATQLCPDSRVRAWYIRGSREGKAVLCAAVTEKGALAKNAADSLRELYPRIAGVAETVVDLHKPLSFTGRYTAVSGDIQLSDKLAGMLYKISPASFYQVNPPVAEAIYGSVADAVSDCREILDLYCGMGTISLTVAKANPAAHVTGVEIVPAAVADAKNAAALNGISNAEFICADAGDYAAKADAFDAISDAFDAKTGAFTAEGCIKADAVILDPPRAGCSGELLKAAAATGARVIAYVSCNPATLARDVRILGELGYRADKVTPYDMFPLTGHVETCVLLSHKNS